MENFKQKSMIFKCYVYYVLKVYRSSFSAVAACTFNWPMIDLLRNKDESLEEWTAPAFKCNQ